MYDHRDQICKATEASQILSTRNYNPTIEENLDSRIQQVTTHLEELLRIKESMPADLLKMKIQDLRTAMDY